MTQHTDVLSASRTALLAAFGQHLRRNENYDLVDFPNYSNVGDSAIWLGSFEILHQLSGRYPSYTCSMRYYKTDKARETSRGGPIFVQGGGNLGDVWPHHNRFLVQLMYDFPDRKIVQLPQSIHFQDEANAKVLASAIQRHGDFHLMVRDCQSFDFSRKHFECPVDLVPDGAFGLSITEPNVPTKHEVFCLFRTDREKSKLDYSAIHAISPFIRDWTGKHPVPSRRLKLQALFQTLLAGSWSKRQAKAKFLNLIAQHRLNRGLTMLASGNIIMTDRLHGHILCVLMHKPHVVLDNSYGKVSGYHQQWLKDATKVVFAKTPEEAVQSLHDLRKEVQ